MITKGIIEGVDLKNYSVKVRLPVFDKIPGDPNATSYDALPPATICVPKGQYPQFNIGDIVFVGCENNNRSNPVILGMLFKNNIDKEIVKSVNQVLKVTDEAYLPKNTKVGETNIQSLAYPVGSIYQNVDPLFDVEGTFGGKWQHYTLNTPSIHVSHIDKLSDYYMSRFNIVNNVSTTTETNKATVIKNGASNIVKNKFYCVRITVDVDGQPMFYNKTVKCTQFISPWNSNELGMPLEGLTFNLNGITYHSYILQQSSGLKLEMNGFDETTGTWPGNGLNYASCQVIVNIFNVTDASNSLKNLNRYVSVAESNITEYNLRFDFTYSGSLDPMSCQELLLNAESNYVTFKAGTDKWIVAFYKVNDNHTASIFIVPVTSHNSVSADISVESINLCNYWRRIE